MKKRFFKSVVAVTVVAAGIIGSMSVSARQMWLHVNNQGVQREVCQVWGFDMLPILDIAGELGFSVTTDGSKAVLSNANNSYTFRLGDATVYDAYGNWYGLDVVPQYIKGRFMIPAKFFIDVFGCSYVWDPVMDYLFINSEYMYNEMINSESYEMAKKYYRSDFKQKAREYLGIPAYLEVDAICGAPYCWTGAGMYMIPISFYHNGELVARADFDIETRENAKSILMYNGK